MPKLFVVEDEDPEISFKTMNDLRVICKKREFLWKDEGSSTICVNKVLKEGVWLAEVVFLSRNPKTGKGAIGICKKGWLESHKTTFMGNDPDSIDYNANGELFYKSDSYPGNEQWAFSNIIGAEINMENKTVAFFVNRVLQQHAFSNIPDEVQFGVCGGFTDAGVRLVTFKQLPGPSFDDSQSSMTFHKWNK
ncbi:hypothetical protein BLNAU_11577 [Blattamonas nauphoetae]|uniref:SPRY domain-containing protein n=1 Tax=Blattamonas nauphoetae TaxID=2049346 RepID=A0ABQ9XM00_9EUKA|nr:hypothetical protein BLNAU_11577 [Blattamonas nauphoetae]